MKNEEPLPAGEQRRLAEENASLRRELEDVRWAAEKTNQGIKHLYRELERQNRELHKLDVLKSEFISTVSHELRTPLAIIREAVAQILDGVQGPISPSQQQTLSLTLRGADRLTRLVTDLLDLSKLESGKLRLKLEPHDLAECAREAVKSLAPVAARKKIELMIQAPQTLRTYVDRDKFDQILTNLLSNALKFTDAGRVRLILDSDGQSARVVVEDTGIGISPEDLPRVFSKFEQFSRNRLSSDKGAGLGLAICKGLVDMHGGTITVDSKPDQGSRFEAKIPLRTAQQAVDETLKRMKDLAVQRGTALGLITTTIRSQKPSEVEAIGARLDGVVRECLRRQEDVFIRDGGRIWVLLPEADRMSSRVVFDRVREKIDAFLARESAGKLWAEHGLTLVEHEGSSEFAATKEGNS